jgi:hypothetical protein
MNHHLGSLNIGFGTIPFSLNGGENAKMILAEVHA